MQRRLSMKILLGTVLLLGMTAPAAGDAKLNSLIQEITAGVEKKLSAEFTEKSFAAEQKLAWPVPRPKQSMKAILEETRDQIQKNYADKLADPPLKKLQDRAALRYPLYEKGDYVDLETSHPSFPRVQGIINGISDDKLVVGTRWIRILDLPRSARVALNRPQTQKMRMQYMQEMIQAFTRQKNRFLLTQIRKAYPEKMKAAGYVRNPEGGDNCLSSAYWTTRADQFQADYRKRYNELKAEKTDAALDAALPGQGYCRDQKTRKWRKMTFMEKLKNKI